MVYLQDGYVFYQRLNSSDGDPRWRQLYQSAMSDFASIQVSAEKISYSAISERLISIGQAEQKKEKQLLEEIFGVYGLKNFSGKDYTQFIKILNELMGLKSQFKNLLAKMKKSEGKGRAPTGASYFDSYLTTTISDRLRNFIDTQIGLEIIAEGNYNSWLEQLTKRIELAIEDAVKKVSEQTDNLDGEDVQIWKEAAQLLQKTNGQLEQFKSDVFKRYNLQRVIRDLFDWQTTRYQANRKTTRGLSKQVRTSMRLGELGARSAAGFVEEYIVSAMQSAAKGSYGGGTLKSNMAKSDNIHLFSATVDINLDNIFQNLNDNLDAKNLSESRNLIENFYNNFLNKINDGFVVYENVKNYSLGENFSGFSAGVEQPLSALPGVLSTIGSNIDGHSLVNGLYNTIGGAIGEGRQDFLKEQTKLAISSAAANFLFDDWQMIGTPNDRSIHIFNLSGVLVPLSYLLISMGETVRAVQSSSSQYFKVSIKLPSEIKWRNPISLVKGENIYDYWDIQRAEVEANSTFSIKFLANFKSLIGQLI